MKKLLLGLLLSAVVMLAPSLSAQVVTTSPAVVQENSTDIVITFHADRGSRGLMGLTASTPVYAHTGVITNLSTSPSDWKYAPKWGDNSAKYRMTWVADNTWTLTIPSIHSYYGVPAGESVEKLAFVFRNADGSREGKGDGGSDIFVDVLPDGFHLELTSSLSGQAVKDDSPVTFTAATTSASDIAIYVGGTSTTPIASKSGVTELTATYSFTKAGTYEVTAVAKSGSNTLTETINVTRLGASAQVDYPGGKPKMGPVNNADGSVTFCLAAPGKQSVILVPSWNGYTVDAANTMNYQDYNGHRYFWITVKGLEAGRDYPYYFLVDGTVSVGDPYARLVLDPWNDRWITPAVYPGLPEYPSDKVTGVPLAVYNSKSDEYDWKVRNFKGVAQSDLIIYELLIRDFTGPEGRADGSGTVEGVIGKLDYLKKLGVNAVELLPIMEFNGNNSWGYNTNFYFAPDKAYGTPDDYRRLVDECHARGMAVILDIVFNQSDGLHPWYQMYPIAENPFYNGSAPHAYSVLNDWNQDNALVQQQWKDALDYWMTAYNVDGFRFDLVKGLGDNNSYGNTYNPATNTFGTPSDYNTNRYNATRVARMKELHASMKLTRPDAYFINENLATAQEENEMAADGEINWANVNYSSCQFAMGYDDGASLNRFYAPLDERTWGSTVSYAESHDEERMAYKQRIYGATGVRGNTAMMMRRLGSVAAQMILSPGAHMIWQFQEFGADQTTKNADGGNNTDPKRVIWSYLDDPDRDGLRKSYMELNAVRVNAASLFTEQATASVNCSGWANGRSIVIKNGGTELYLVVNPNVSGETTVATSTDLSASRYHLLSTSYGVTPEPSTKGVKLPAGAYAVYATTDVSGIDDIEYDFSATRPVVYVSGRDIIVEGEHDNVTVTAVSGITVPTTGLVPGIYLVTVDGYTVKVAVR